MNRRTLLQISVAAAVLPSLPLHAQDTGALAHEAFLYAYPMVKNYLTLYQYALEPGGKQYKGPLNTLTSIARVYTPEDTAIITPNSDTPYSFMVMDLRAEPLVVTLPAIEADRYYSAQIIDLYTHNVDYLGTRMDGNGGGDFLIAGPGWQGEAPAGIKRVVRIPTDLGLVVIRTQLFAPDDIGKVEAIQAGYSARTLSAYEGKPAPAPAPAIDWPAIDDDRMLSEFWPLTAFLLQFAPPLAWEGNLRDSFAASLGLQAGTAWPPASLPEGTVTQMRDLVRPSDQEIRNTVAHLTDSAKLFGTPEFMKGRYMDRAAAAQGGIYGNTAQEALYVIYNVDAKGALLDGKAHHYALRFAADALPPVSAFWSITMYDKARQLLVDNPINRYLINSPMLSGLNRDEAGAIVIHLQSESPGEEQGANWLPTPSEGFYAVMRLYLPKDVALDGRWKPPVIEIVS
ncbi:DUF1254 domain-containing protein [Paracoccus sp. MBLB3053]|uniref:DUF1254 domain-containing protein n=1 Tax=Paracoccus aurantius TaxID=3073814 RepID=A0ABU2HX51_9RHOB|nr:DUF1254 domain-containing protein [Paracoccus sp. MBLB3053]MDS9469634.1 DUF1254 domain-containing protein [Paracoccus sp. MBLB3053]